MHKSTLIKLESQFCTQQVHFDMFEHNDFTKHVSAGAKNTSSWMIIQVLNKPPGRPHLLGREKGKNIYPYILLKTSPTANFCSHFDLVYLP